MTHANRLAHGQHGLGSPKVCPFDVLPASELCHARRPDSTIKCERFRNHRNDSTPVSTGAIHNELANIASRTLAAQQGVPRTCRSNLGCSSWRRLLRATTTHESPANAQKADFYVSSRVPRAKYLKHADTRQVATSLRLRSTFSTLKIHLENTNQHRGYIDVVA